MLDSPYAGFSIIFIVVGYQTIVFFLIEGLWKVSQVVSGAVPEFEIVKP